MKSSSQSSIRKIHLIIILLSYILFAATFAYAYRYAMNPDGISMLRLAGYVAEGNFWHSITRAWSPLLDWLIAPLLWAGFDGLTAARIIIALCGAGLLTGSWILSSRFNLPDHVRFVAVLIAGLLIAFWTIQFISSDVLVAALLVGYFCLTTYADILHNRKTSLLCGVFGGLAYLAHHYAFPFFLVHFPSVLLLRGYIDREKAGFPLKKIIVSWGTGMAAFLMIASLWIGAVSVKYGHFTISSKGPIAHAAVGPKGKGHPFFSGGLYVPRDSYAIHVFEDPSEVKFKTWSPFESRENFLYQLGLIKENAGYILDHFVTQSPFFVRGFVIGVLTIIPIAFLAGTLDDKKRFLYLWIVVTFSIYCSGFLLITARSPRRFYALMIIFLFMAFHFQDGLVKILKDIVPLRRVKIISAYLLLIVIAAFAVKPGIQLLKSVKNIATIRQVNPYREMAEQISAVDFPGPYAIIRTSQKLTTDYYLAYFLDKQLLGRPLSQDLEGITHELTAAGAKSLMVFDNPALVEQLKRDRRYKHIFSRKLMDGQRYAFAVNLIIKDHEIVTGWDKEVNIFTIR
jgi:hypothetical protein